MSLGSVVTAAGLRVFTAHALPYINSVLGLQAFCWILEP